MNLEIELKSIRIAEANSQPGNCSSKVVLKNRLKPKTVNCRSPTITSNGTKCVRCFCRAFRKIKAHLPRARYSKSFNSSCRIDPSPLDQPCSHDSWTTLKSKVTSCKRTSPRPGRPPTWPHCSNVTIASMSSSCTVPVHVSTNTETT